MGWKTSLQSYKFLLPVLLMLCCFGPLKADIIIIANSVPDYTPTTDTIFLAGTFNNWTAEDPDFMMTKQNDGSFIYVFKDDIKAFKYKFTRGGWHTVEGSSNGDHIDNRTFVFNPNGENIVVNNIQSWVDLAIIEKPQISILLEAPENTPHDAALYLTGNFNGWNPNDDQYRFKKIFTQTYLLNLEPGLDTFQCKVTRGDWKSVEGRPNGKARQNRKIEIGREDDKEVKMTVESWEDLSYPLNLYSLILLFAVFQGILLVITLFSIQNNNRQANFYLSTLIILVSISLFTKVAAYDRSIFQSFPKILLVPEFIFFLYGPLFFRYIQKLTTFDKRSTTKFWLSLVPFLLFVAANIPFLLIDHQTFIDKEVDSDFDIFFTIVGAAGLAFNFWFWVQIRKLIRQIGKQLGDNHSFEQNITYLRTVLILLSLCLVLWSTVYLIGLYDWLFQANATWAIETLTDSVWLIFASINFILGYFAINQPEIFKIDTVEKYKDSNLSSTAIGELKESLLTAMEANKAYLNSQLTLAELAKKINTNTHTLSRVINEGFNKNFFDFVNEYRINHFIQEISKAENADQSFLSTAYASGFNSKTSFNRSFKKIKGATPREYLQHITENH